MCDSVDIVKRHSICVVKCLAIDFLDNIFRCAIHECFIAVIRSFKDISHFICRIKYESLSVEFYCGSCDKYENSSFVCKKRKILMIGCVHTFIYYKWGCENWYFARYKTNNGYCCICLIDAGDYTVRAMLTFYPEQIEHVRSIFRLYLLNYANAVLVYYRLFLLFFFVLEIFFYTVYAINSQRKFALAKRDESCRYYACF